MKRIIVSLLLLSVLALTSCGKNTVDLTTETSQLKEETVSEIQSATTDLQSETEKKEDTTPVVIQRLALIFDSQGIDEYVKKLQEENPDKEYSVYNDKYYNETITESERKKSLEFSKDKTYTDGMMKDLFTDEQFNGAFLSIEYNDTFTEFTIRADKEKYNNAGISAMFGPYIYAGSLNDIYQAMNKVKPEDRVPARIIIVDDATEEIILDSNDSKSE